jgi:hypothetical protein
VGCLLIGASVGVAPVQAQITTGVGVDYMEYAFEEGLGVDAAQLFMVPLAVRVPVSASFAVDVFSAWAEGRVERDQQLFRLSGPVDTGLKLSFQATPWALVSVGANLPTGNAAHDSEEALVASVLSTDLLGFRESSWGTGAALTTSVASAVSAGGFGIGVAAAYAARGAYEPAEGVGLSYRPGNETRLRVGVDRAFGSSTVTAGATVVDFADDAVDDQELFRTGRRLRLDAAYAFRVGSGVWTVYAANLSRANGDLRLATDEGTGVLVTDSSMVTASQNLVTGGVIGSFDLGGGFVLRPHVDLTLQNREEANGNRVGSGWIVAAGGDVPVRLWGSELFPRARVFFGGMRDALGGDAGIFGMEFKGTVRTRLGR